ncbi:DUF2092 domain-containing protein [Devosia sp. ZB163]|uniref:DUF2092 domain-containing protein n=1 Tax=Devosia sp. ZB163 TaxID=3025938 RepID=UPI0030811325
MSGPIACVPPRDISRSLVRPGGVLATQAGPFPGAGGKTFNLIQEDRLSAKFTLKVTSRTVAIAGIAALAGLAGAIPSQADEADAKTLLKQMSDYLAAQKAFSFDYDSDLEVVTKDQQKLALASSGNMAVERPDKLRAERVGGFTDVEVVYDGKTLSILGDQKSAYSQAELPGTLDQLFDTLRDKYGRPISGADLLLSDVYDALMPEVKDVKDLGSGVIGGVECNHLAFRTDEVDWQIWIATGADPYPCRYVVTSKEVPGSPEYRVDLRNWKAGDKVAQADFGFQPPANAKKVEMSDLPETDELPKSFAVGGTK